MTLPVSPAELVQAVNNPYSLAALALTLVFLILGGRRAKKNKPRERWFFLGLAALTLVGALALALLQSTDPAPAEEKAKGPAVSQTDVTTTGKNSPAVVGTGGDVEIEIKGSTSPSDLGGNAKREDPPQ